MYFLCFMCLPAFFLRWTRLSPRFVKICNESASGGFTNYDVPRLVRTVNADPYIAD